MNHTKTDHIQFSNSGNNSHSTIGHQFIKWTTGKIKMPGTNAMLIFGLVFLTTIWNIDRASSRPYLNIVKQIGKCNSTEGHTVTLDNYRIIRYRRTDYVFNGELAVLEELNDEGTEIFLLAEVWGTRGWRNNFFNETFEKACSTLRQLSPNLVEAIFQQANITGCPIPQGTYVFKNLVLNLDITVPLPRGLYRITLVFLKDNRVFFCVVFILDIAP